MVGEGVLMVLGGIRMARRMTGKVRVEVMITGDTGPTMIEAVEAVEAGRMTWIGMVLVGVALEAVIDGEVEVAVWITIQGAGVGITSHHQGEVVVVIR